jgi:hypothetical protein
MASRVTVHLWLFAGLVALWAAVAAPAQAQQSTAAPLTQAQLDQLVAPIALHPDPLLSQMLMASRTRRCHPKPRSTHNQAIGGKRPRADVAAPRSRVLQRRALATTSRAPR